MKTIFTLLLVFFAIFCFGQTTFRTAIDGFGGLELYDLVQMNDGTYVGTGSSYSNVDDFTKFISVVRLNSQGELIASQTISTDSEIVDIEGIAIIKTSDDGVAISGTIDGKMSLLKFDASLALQWYKQYSPSSVNSYGAKVIQATDGGYLVAGSLESTGTYGYYDAGYIVKTDSQGNVTWSKQFFDYGDNNIADIIATKDGNYALLANAYSDSAGVSDSTYLIKINSSGTVLWSVYVVASLYGQDGYSLLSASDGGLVVCGSLDKLYTQTEFAQIMLMKFDQSGSLLWSRAGANSSADTYPWDIIEDKDGGYVVSGGFDPDNNGQNYSGSFSYLLKVDNSGTLQWTKALSVPNSSEYFYSLITTSDGGYATSGNIYSYNNVEESDDYDRGLIYKFNSDFTICGNVVSPGNLVKPATTAISKIPASYDVLTVASNSSNISINTAGSGINLCGILPLQILSFNATLQNKKVDIEWKTANEINTDYFIVERSNNTLSFTTLQKVMAKGSTSSVQTYTANDLQPLSGTSYYRLKLLDKDGTITYSNIVPVMMTSNRTIVINPNPVHNDIRIAMLSQVSSQLTFRVTDMTGKTLITQTTKVNEGTNTVSIPANSLTSGMYILKVIENNRVESIKFIKE